MKKNEYRTLLIEKAEEIERVKRYEIIDQMDNKTFAKDIDEDYDLNHFARVYSVALQLAKEDEKNASKTAAKVIRSVILDLEEDYEAAKEYRERKRIAEAAQVKIESLEQFGTLPEKVQELILHRAVRNRIRFAKSHVDKDGNAAPLPYSFFVDEPYFNCNIDAVKNETYIRLYDPDIDWTKKIIDKESGKEITIPFVYVLCSCATAALQHIYRKEFKHANASETITRKKAEKLGYKDIPEDMERIVVIDLEAYETHAPSASDASTAVTRAYVESMGLTKAEKKDLMELAKGYGVMEIARATGTDHKIVSERLKSALDKIRLFQLGELLNVRPERIKARANENATKKLRKMVMLAKSREMTDKQIAINIGVEPEDIPELLNGVTMPELLEMAEKYDVLPTDPQFTLVYDHHFTPEEIETRRAQREYSDRLLEMVGNAYHGERDSRQELTTAQAKEDERRKRDLERIGTVKQSLRDGEKTA